MTVPPGGPAYDAPPPPGDDGTVLVPAPQHEVVPAGYGQEYAPPTYWTPGYGYAYAYPPARRTNVLAVLSLVFAFVFPPAGLVLGLVARAQVRETGEDGRGLAVAGIAVSAGSLGLVVVGVVVYVLLLLLLAVAVLGLG